MSSGSHSYISYTSSRSRKSFECRERAGLKSDRTGSSCGRTRSSLRRLCRRSVARLMCLTVSRRGRGLDVAGTAGEGAAEIAEPLRGNSNVALSFGAFLAAPLLCFASEPGGGNHLHGPSNIGKTMDSAVGQSIYGWPHEMA